MVSVISVRFGEWASILNPVTVERDVSMANVKSYMTKNGKKLLYSQP